VSSTIPLAEAHTLRRRALATGLVFAVLAAAAVAATVGVLLVSRSTHSQTLVPLPSKANVVIVLDLSASISSDSFSRIGGTLSALSQTGDRVGLVVFSTDAYEALPPGVPAADLAPLVRYFTLPKQRAPGFIPSFPANPWAQTFTGGTSISAGIEMAIDIAAAQRPRAAVVLVSDLDDDPNDLATLAGAGAVARHDRIPIRIVGLNPSPEDVRYFRTIFGSGTPIADAPTLEQAAPRQQTPFPWALVGLAVAAALALTLREAWAPRLRWRGPA
jgi:von Willebrand factor type A domain